MVTALIIFSALSGISAVRVELCSAEAADEA